MELNPAQAAIAQHLQGAILVLAPAGTGKTRVLTARLIQALKAGFQAQDILCLTFTNRAAQEMKTRVRQAIPDQAEHLTIKTFHGLCAWMLRQEATAMGLPADFTIFDDSDCQELVQQIFNLSDARDVKKYTRELMTTKSRGYWQDGDGWLGVFRGLGDYAPQGVKYQLALQKRHALDFADLIYYVRRMLRTDPEIAQRWQQRFKLLQIDEVQDTHSSEYEIVAHLGRGSGNMAMIGDLDQTIFEWRGSEPDLILSQFRQEFQPQVYELAWNYRATQSLLATADQFAQNFAHRHTQITAAPSCPAGPPPIIHQAPTAQAEADWIGQQIQEMARKSPNFSYSRTTVLARNHFRLAEISTSLKAMGIPCLTVEQFEFFQRQEVKDALALIRLLLNPFDATALRRLLLQLVPQIGLGTINTIQKQGQACGLWLTDLIDLPTLEDGDPFQGILQAQQSGKIIVFDVETTGLSVAESEVIEIAAQRYDGGEHTLSFQRFITNLKPVGETEAIHGYSDQFLMIRGRPAKEVFREFQRFAQGAYWIGHNLGFDIKMITAHARRVGLEFNISRWGDTLNLAHRFVQAPNYKLATLAKHFQLKQTPTHKADDDVRTTVELLNCLLPLTIPGRPQRQALIQRYQRQFFPFARQLYQWRQASDQLRPGELIRQIIQDSGLYRHYSSQPERLENLDQLIDVFTERDQAQLHPHTALREIIEFTALTRNVDRLTQAENLVPLITVHQAKGLEFDRVFVAGLADGEFPSFRSVQEGRLEEEKRLFYVALTRAQQQLYLSTHEQDDRSKKAPSPFLTALTQA
ncbi:DNA/RNA helicase, superfamily I [Synechococcus sp. PCC 6312]|nr:DNA/RNA helicase, superfamily I [Synechococcus sp. PCC 6312]